jgi:NitT/TauT family transport system substrate-binding protein
MKKTVFCLLLTLLLLSGAACAPAAPPQEALEVAVLRGPGSIGAAWLMEQAANGQGNYNFHLADNPEQAVALLSNGTVSMAALPTNLAANLYAKTEGQMRMSAIITRGMLYLLQAGATVQSWEDLRGQTIYATGRGSNPEYILRHLLEAHGLKPGLDVTVEFKSDHAELAALLAAGQAELAMLPEPFVTSVLMQNDGVFPLFDLSAEWEALGTGSLAMTALVTRTDFAAANPQIITGFLDGMEQSVNYALNNVAETAALCEKYGIIPKAAVAERAIPRCNLTFIAGADMQGVITPYYEVLYAADPQSIGGALPDEDFYYVR